MIEKSVFRDVRYRKLTTRNSKQYRNIRLESLQKYPSHFGSRYVDQKSKVKLAFEIYIENSNPQCFVVGAFHINEVIGICAFSTNKDEGCRHRGEIIQMYVQAKYQCNKIGFNLLKTTIRIAFNLEELEQIELAVNSNIKPANRIYEKLGFEEYGVLKNFKKVDGLHVDQRLMMLRRRKEKLKKINNNRVE